MNNKILNGHKLSAELLEDLADVILSRRGQGYPSPCLAFITVGKQSAAAAYVASIERRARRVGIQVCVLEHSEDVEEKVLQGLIINLNGDPTVDGVILQMPLPAHLDRTRLVELINPRKDVDGLHPVNVGRLAISPLSASALGVEGGDRDFHVPCVAQGALELLKRSGYELKGKHVVVMGRSATVGLPLSLAVQKCDATVTVCHGETSELESMTRLADVLVVATGNPQLVTADFIKEGCIVIDIGINEVLDGKGSTRIVGDVDFNGVVHKCDKITPVPGECTCAC